ncbi:MAG: EAL domain-containing protein [Gammaproteobacteria bacterium]|nr:EAL domain-containing protein [Gammaproteobacteria bacterium]
MRQQDCENWRALAEDGEALLCRFDRDGRLIHANNACARFFGAAPSELVGRHLTSFVEAGDGQRLTEDLLAIRDGHEAHQAERPSCRADGTVRTLLWQHQRVLRAGRPDGWHAIALDVTDLHEARAVTERLVYNDPLTDLPNRRLFEDRLQRAEARFRRDGTRFALLLLDIDHFKQINDSFGHATGDALLQEVAARLLRTLRETDTVARLGGDEFAILQPQVDREAGVDAVARKILATMGEPIRVHGHEVRIGVSIGVAVARPPSAEGGTDGTHGDAIGKRLFEQADRALYAVKESGRGFHTFDTSALGSAALSELELAHALDAALVDGGLYLLWQPEYDLRNQRISGVEALLRWRRADGSIVGPGRLIPVAERHGLMQRLGDWVLECALAQFASWRHAGVDVPRLGINVSALQFRDEAFVEHVHDALERHGLPGHVLELEIAEPGIGVDGAAVLRGLERLAGLGVSVAIDDFGSGTSSFGALRRLSVGRVKVAQEFAERALDRSADRAVLHAAISLAGGLGVETVVEGVESAAALASMRALGVGSIQGYLVAVPEESVAMERMLRNPGEIRSRLAVGQASAE